MESSNIIIDSEIIKKELERSFWFKHIITTIDIKDKIEIIKEKIINRTIAVYDQLDSEDEKKIFLEIIVGIDLILYSDYLNLLNKCYINLRRNNKDIEEFIIAPLVISSKSDNAGRIKSGYLVSYLFNTYFFSLIDEVEKFEKVKINIIHKLDVKTIERVKDSEKIVVVFVDDFIGTGRSAMKVWDSYRKFVDITEEEFCNKFCVLSLTILDIGVEKLVNHNVNLIYGKYSESLNTLYREDREKLERVTSLVRKLSKKNGIRTNISLGYNDSMSKIITLRPANNNLPFLWSSKINKNKPLFLRSE